MIAITAATGQLGQLVVEQLLTRVSASSVVAVVRNPAKAAPLAARGVIVRAASYDDPAALERAFAGVEKVLLISGSDLGRRVEQHRNVIAAAQRAGARLVVYTSVLRAHASPLTLAADHFATEQTLRQSGVPFVILRNGWYHENYTAGLPAALQHGALVGSAGQGRISSAARADYATAAAIALTGGAPVNEIYELAGDTSYTLAEFAAEVSRQSHQSVPYVNLSEADYAGVLEKAELPRPFAEMIASGDAGVAQGAVFDDQKTLSRLIGRPTTPVADAIRAALRQG